MSRCSLAPSFWHWSKYNLWLCSVHLETLTQDIQSQVVKQDTLESTWFLGWKKTKFYCRALNRCLKDTSLSAFVHQVVVEVACASKEMRERRGETEWLGFKTDRGCLLYKLYLHKDRLPSYWLDLKINPPMSQACVCRDQPKRAIKTWWWRGRGGLFIKLLIIIIAMNYESTLYQAKY